MTRDIRFSTTFRHSFRRLPADERRRVFDAIGKLAADPFARLAGLDVKPVRGAAPPKFRLRIGRWRVVYSVEGEIVYLYDVFDRNRGYRE